MFKSIEIKCDVSGINKKYSGEVVVARFGVSLSNINIELNEKISFHIRKICNNKNYDNSLFSIVYDENQGYIINKRFPLSYIGKSATGTACTQVTCSFISGNKFKLFLLSSLFDKYFLVNNVTDYINYYIENNKCYNLKKDYVDKINNMHQQNFKYFLTNNNKDFFLTELSQIKFFILSKILIRKKFSVLIGNFNKKFENVIQHVNAIETSLTNLECRNTSNEIKNLKTLYKSMKIMESLNIKQIENILQSTSKSIEINLNTIKTLSDTLKDKKHPIFQIKNNKVIYPEVDEIISNSLVNIDNLVKIQLRFIKNLEYQTNQN
jgi:hypothetical protein